MDKGALKGALKGAYKEWLDSPVGQDFLNHLKHMEITLQANAFQEQDHCKKASYTDKQAALYSVRSYIDEMSKPPKAASVPMRQHSVNPGR